MSQLVPRKRDGGTPMEEVFTGEFAAKAKRAVTELALLKENSRLAVPMGPGTGSGQAGEAVVADAGHAAGDEGPAVAGNARGRGASRAPRDARMVLTGSDPGGTHSRITAGAASLGEIGTVSRGPSCDTTRDAGREEPKNVESSGEGTGIGEGGPFLAIGGPPFPAARACSGPLREGLGLPVVAAPVDFVPNGFVDGRASPAEEGARDGARRGRRERAQ